MEAPEGCEGLPVLNVLDYRVGDLVDANAAMRALLNLPQGGSVYYPAGTYLDGGDGLFVYEPLADVPATRPTRGGDGTVTFVYVLTCLEDEDADHPEVIGAFTDREEAVRALLENGKRLEGDVGYCCLQAFDGAVAHNRLWVYNQKHYGMRNNPGKAVEFCDPRPPGFRLVDPFTFDWVKDTAAEPTVPL